MVIKEIPYGSPLYEATKAFREEVLRRPLGLVLSDKDIAGEDTQIHIAAMEGETVVGTVLLKPLSGGCIKLRQMAISPTLQGNGAGRQLVQFAESVAKVRSSHTMEMHARVFAQGFYEKLGYQATGEPFIEATVSTIKMTKTLQNLRRMLKYTIITISCMCAI
jgi:predicted GNAT family N-acyltransferase